MSFFKYLVASTILMFAAASDLSAQWRVEAAVNNIRSDKGVCRACLFSSEAAYKANQPYRCVVVAPKDKKATVVFEAVPEGSYAMFVFHDTNNNGKMDTNFMGIPTEGYGASGNNLPFASTPSFKGNKFRLSGPNVQLAIRLRHL